MGSKNRVEVIARGLLVHNGRVLVCRNIKGDYTYLPGGHVEFGERASTALEREFLEETGLTARAGKMLLGSEQYFEDPRAPGSASSPARPPTPHHEINLVFLVEQLGPSPTPPDPVPSVEKQIAFDWIDLAQLPETDLRPTEIKAWLMSGGGMDPQSGPWISGFGTKAR